MGLNIYCQLHELTAHICCHDNPINSTRQLAHRFFRVKMICHAFLDGMHILHCAMILSLYKLGPKLIDWCSFEFWLTVDGCELWLNICLIRSELNMVYRYVYIIHKWSSMDDGPPEIGQYQRGQMTFVACGW